MQCFSVQLQMSWYYNILLSVVEIQLGWRKAPSALSLLGFCASWSWWFNVTAYHFSRPHICYACSAQQELPGGREPASKDWRLWHVQGCLQHWLLQGRCMCPPLYFLLLLLLISCLVSLIPAAWILPSSSPACACHHQLRDQTLVGSDYLPQLKRSMAATLRYTSTVFNSLGFEFFAFEHWN